MHRPDQFHNDQNPCGENGYYDYNQEESGSPQWYGVSYGGSGGNSYKAKIGRKPRRRSYLLPLTFALAVCVLISGLAGFGGYLIANTIYGGHPGTDQGGIYLPSGADDNHISTESVFPGSGAAEYAYQNVVITQRGRSEIPVSSNGSAGESGMGMVDAIAAVRDSVVEIATTTVSYQGRLTSGAGSGVIIHSDGIIVTNNHVIDGVDTIYVRLTNGNTYEAYLRGTDEENDIAVLKIMPQETLTVAKLGCSSALLLGESVFAIGNPLGELGGTVTNGIISALEREVEMEEGAMTLLQTNAAINSGNSGGGLFNMAGELIGVVNAKYAAAGVEGLGFAIPVDTAILSINGLLAHGYMPGRASLGVSLSEKNVILSGRLTTIPYVYDAPANSVLRVGDYIYKIGDVTVSTVSELRRALRAYTAGEEIEVTIFRSKAQKVVRVRLSEYVPAGA